MNERSIGIRELKAKLSACVREVKRGKRTVADIVVENRG